MLGECSKLSQFPSKNINPHKKKKMENKGGADRLSGQKKPVISDQAVDFFYEKVCKLNESSALSLVFNFRQTILDLHQFYKEVIKRGGFYQVTKMGKWSEVASASNLNSSKCMSPAQLKNVYEVLVLEYELMYSCKMPDQANKWPDKSSIGISYTETTRPNSSTGKRKQSDSSSPSPKIRCGPKTGQKNASKITIPDSNTEESILMAPLKPRTGYHIFLKLETHKSKMTLGESSNTQNLPEKAPVAWRALSDEQKLPYIEASKMDKERYEKEMAAYEQQQLENQNANNPTLHEKEQQQNQNAKRPALYEKEQQQNQNAKSPTLNEKDQQENQNAKSPSLNEK